MNKKSCDCVVHRFDASSGHAVSRRNFIAGVGAAASIPMIASMPAWAAEQKKGLLPVNTPKVDHLDVIVPDVEKTARFYMGVFNTRLHAQPFQGKQRYFVLLGDLPENRQVGYLAIGDSRGRGTYIGHFCTSVFDYRQNAAAITKEMTAAFEKAGFGTLPSRGGGVGGIFADPDGIEIQFLPAPDTLVTAAVPSDLVEYNKGLVTPKGVDHALLKVSDMKKALEFYRILYGKETNHDRKTGRTWFHIGDTRLGLEEVQYKFGDGNPRIEHFCVKVAPFDRDTVSAGLAKLGAQVLPSPDEPDVLRFRDVDGITAELKAV
jgi:catechol 2,3-dioxygenase-like lactoylglutathione lyase family enzyme